MSKRTQLDHLHQQILGEIDSLTARLEAVAGKADDLVGQLQTVPETAKREMGEAVTKPRQTVTALRPDGAQFVNLGPNALGGVRHVVSAALAEWNPNLAPAIHEAVQHGPTAEALKGVNIVLEKIARDQVEVLRRQQEQQAVDWKRVGTFAAVCLVSSIIGGLVMWALI